MRSGLTEFDPHRGLVIHAIPKIHEPAILEEQPIAQSNRMLHQDEGAVGVDHLGEGLLGETGTIKILATHGRPNDKKQPLASADIAGLL